MKNYFCLRTVLIPVILLMAGFAYSAESVHLFLKPTKGGKTLKTTVNNDGSFTFPEVESGEYEVRVELYDKFHDGDIPNQDRVKPKTIEIESFSLGASNLGSATMTASKSTGVRTADLDGDGMRDVVVAVMQSPLRKGSKIKMSTGDEPGTLKGSLGKVTITAGRKTKELTGHVTLIK